MKNLKEKFSALFHDPLNKSLVLFEGEGHEEVAKELADELQIPWEITDRAKLADQIASSMERIFITKDMKAVFAEKPFFIHPLSGEYGKIAGVNRKIKEEVKATIKEAFRKLSNFPHGGQPAEDFYLFLWAFMKKFILEEGRGLEEFWEKAPADTRIPDHSIWEHIFSTSALAGVLPKPALLIFSITPVQSFISTARKTRDFWMGSYILSWLSWKAMEAIAEEYGPDSVVYPELHDQPLVKLWLLGKFPEFPQELKSMVEEEKASLKKELLFPTLPNRFVAFVDWDDGERMARKAEERARRAFEEISDFVRNKIGKSDDELSRLWDRQVKNYFQITWVIIPFLLKDKNVSGKAGEVDELIQDIEKFYREIPDFASKIIGIYKNWKANLQYPANIGFLYPVVYDIGERLAGAQKGLRTRGAVVEYGYKCTLCGEREALHPQGKVGWDELNLFWKNLRESLGPLGYFLREDEKLCGICLTKRFASLYFEEKIGEILGERGYFSNSFPSTADMAVFSFKKRVLENRSKIKKEIQEFINAFEKIPEKLRGPLGFVKNSVLYRMVKDGDEVLKKFASMEGEWLFEERYLTRLREAEGEEASNLKEALEKLREFLEAVKEKIHVSPGRYYAVLKLDGDSMGKTLKGEKNSPSLFHYHQDAKQALASQMKGELEEIPRPISIPVHRAISSALRNYSLELVPEIVEGAGGKVVFAGGDDVFALLPLEGLLPTVEKLRAAFSGEVNWGKIAEEKGYLSGENRGWILKNSRHLLSMGKDVSASVGVAIVHWEWPLSLAIKEAGEAEELAKTLSYKGKEKNGFCISFLRRNGSRRRMAFKFYHGEGEKTWLIQDALLKILHLFEEGKLSVSSVYNISQVFRDLLERPPEGKLMEVFKNELIRISMRGQKREIAQELREVFEEIFEKTEGGEALFPQTEKGKLPLKNFTHGLEILGFLAKGGEE